MTYAHALRYLTDNARPDAGDPATLAQLSTRLPAPASSMISVFLPYNRLGSAVAHFLTSVFRQADISVAHILDVPSIPPRERFLINGSAILPPVLAEGCTALQKQELRLHHTVQNLTLSAAERAALVLPRLFVEAGCRVLLLQGEADRPTLSLCADAVRRSHTLHIPDYAVLDTSADEASLRAALLNIRDGLFEVICTTSSAERFRAVSDACAYSGSRLTLATACHTENPLPGNQRVRYRNHVACLLSCGAPSVGVAVALAAETVGALERVGISVSDVALSAGLAAATLSAPDYFNLRSIHPPVVTAAILAPGDIENIAADIAALSSSLPAPHRLWADGQAFPTATHLITQQTDLIPTQEPEAPPDGTLFLVGAPSDLQAVTVRQRSASGAPAPAEKT